MEVFGKYAQVVLFLTSSNPTPPLQHETKEPDMEFDSLEQLLSRESDQVHSQTFFSSFRTSYGSLSFRREAISLISQAQNLCNFDPLMSYLAIDYMDRFISGRNLPEEKPWILKLLVISCLSLAAKMKTIPFSITLLHREQGFNFDVRTIQKMELLILDTLNWRMRSITPLCFLDFFVPLLDLKDSPLKQALKNRTSEIIFNTHYETEILAYKPSIIAASAILYASLELFPPQFSNFKALISSCGHVNEEDLCKCLNLMEEMEIIGGSDSKSDTVSSSKTHQVCTESESENIKTRDDWTRERKGIKRRRLNPHQVCSFSH